jgi:hypothetical protein
MEELAMKSMTKSALYALIASVAVSGLLGVVAILGGGGDPQWRILATTSTISAASLCSLSCAALWERKKKQVLPASGIALTLLGAILVIGAVWANAQSEPYMKLTICVVTFAVATSHLSLLSLASLSGGFRWGLTSAYIADYVLASFITWLVVVGRPPSDFEGRTAGILSIAVASISILIPIFHRLSAASMREEEWRFAEDVMCPCCGTRQPYVLGEMTCPRCESVFAVKVVGRT